MTIKTFQNGNTADSAKLTPHSKDEYMLGQKGKNQVAIGGLDWTNIAPLTNWASTLQVAYISDSVIAMRGTLTSTAATNTSPMVNFPAGFKPLAFSNTCPVVGGSTTNNLTANPEASSYGELSGLEAALNDVITVNLTYIANPVQTSN
jgi:hypothetical protein